MLYYNFTGHMLNHPKIGSKVRQYAFQFPQLKLAANIQPITRNVLRVQLQIVPDFKWNDRMHGTTSEPWWIWVEDPETNNIYHSEYFLLSKKAVFHLFPFITVLTVVCNITILKNVCVTYIPYLTR